MALHPIIGAVIAILGEWKFGRIKELGRRDDERSRGDLADQLGAFKRRRLHGGTQRGDNRGQVNAGGEIRVLAIQRIANNVGRLIRQNGKGLGRLI